jgi:hypothetical protein
MKAAIAEPRTALPLGHAPAAYVLSETAGVSHVVLMPLEQGLGKRATSPRAHKPGKRHQPKAESGLLLADPNGDSDEQCRREQQYDTQEHPRLL